MKVQQIWKNVCGLTSWEEVWVDELLEEAVGHRVHVATALTEPEPQLPLLLEIENYTLSKSQKKEILLLVI